MHQPARFSLLEDGRDYDFYFASPTRLDKLRIDFGSDQGDYELRLGFWDDPAGTYIDPAGLDMRVFDAPPAYRRGGEYLYRVSIGVKNLSGARTDRLPLPVRAQSHSIREFGPLLFCAGWSGGTVFGQRRNRAGLAFFRTSRGNQSSRGLSKRRPDEDGETQRAPRDV